MSAAAGGEVKGGTVVYRSSDYRQPQRGIHRIVETGVFQYRQALVVVHRQHRVGIGQSARSKQTLTPLALSCCKAGLMISISS